MPGSSAGADGVPDVGLGDAVGDAIGVAVGIGLAVGRGGRLAAASWFGFGVGEGDGTGDATVAAEHAATVIDMAIAPHRIVRAFISGDHRRRSNGVQPSGWRLSRLERPMRVAGTETQGEIDDVGGGDALGSGEPCLDGDRIEDPLADLGRAQVLIRGR